MMMISIFLWRQLCFCIEGASFKILSPDFVVCRYGSNMGVVMLNKLLLSNFGFKYPFLLTLLHMLTCSCFCFLLSAARIVPLQTANSTRQLGKIAVLSVVFCLTVVLGNISLRYIPVSFNQAISATTPAFTAVLTFFLQGKVESMLTYATLVPVVGGIVLASRFEPSFHLLGFTSCLLGTAIRALKSVLQVLYQDCC
jgi:drug/metabolite transporter (DMT)-like permease